MQSLLGKRADDGSLPNAQQPALSTAQLTCPPGDTGQIRVPDYRRKYIDSMSFPSQQRMLKLCQILVNCGIFADSLLSRNGQTAPVDGICSGVQRWYTAGGFSNSQVYLTWDKSEPRGNTRRAVSCPSARGLGYCSPSNTRLIAQFNDPTIETSCDEFPFASTEEGGGFYRTLATNPRNPSAVCVPAWQNTLQGNCNSRCLHSDHFHE